MFLWICQTDWEGLAPGHSSSFWLFWNGILWSQMASATACAVVTYIFLLRRLTFLLELPTHRQGFASRNSPFRAFGSSGFLWFSIAAFRSALVGSLTANALTTPSAAIAFVCLNAVAALDIAFAMVVSIVVGTLARGATIIERIISRYRTRDGSWRRIWRLFRRDAICT